MVVVVVSLSLSLSLGNISDMIVVCASDSTEWRKSGRWGRGVDVPRDG